MARVSDPVRIVGTISDNGEEILGNVSIVEYVQSVDVIVEQTLTIHATYASGDYVGVSGECMEFENVVGANGGSGNVKSAVLIDHAKQDVTLELWLFDMAVTPPDDSAAWSLPDTAMDHCIGIIVFDEYYDASAVSVAQAHNNVIGFTCEEDDQSIYGCLVTRGAPSYQSGDLVVRLNVWRDI